MNRSDKPTDTLMTKKNTRKDKPLMRISEAAQAAEVTKSTIEYYVLVGLLKPIREKGKRQRLFDKALIKRIRLIRQMNQSGYTLRAIRETYLRDR